ncbi:MAG: glycoside hydrolase family 3 C-terminal domain-containing protein [Treponemataceae bacterium]|nr:glycoside hydrolase family 3 C-terminal domain-containing protein [Treponemataceae bacterium]
MKATLDWNIYSETARAIAREGSVLLKNDNNALPLKQGEKVAVFGRIQDTYYKSGTGSGGMVNVEKVYGVKDALRELNTVVIDTELESIYADWEKENPFEVGMGWGQEPWNQKEMPLEDAVVAAAASRNDSAIVIIGRTAGEDKDNAATEGSYLLTAAELDMLNAVRKHFKKMTVLLNVGNTIDMQWVETVNPDAVMYIWQGGMVGTLGTADVLCGKASPSGKLADTIARTIDDYPSTRNFGNPQEARYEEDIYVGYRYFETGAKDAVLYPFGFGLSYTTFAQKVTSCTWSGTGKDAVLTVSVTVTNTGAVAGKEVVQLYIGAPEGKLDKPARVLAGFAKTAELAPKAAETVTITVPAAVFASFDDTGATGNADAWVLEAGTYTVFTGSDVRSAAAAGTFTVADLTVIEQLHDCLHPVVDLNRLCAKADGTFGNTTLKAYPPRQIARRNENLGRIKAQLDASPNKALLESLTDEELSIIIRGEGMGSPKVTPGTAAAFGGVSDSLKAKGIPVGCCTDGPSGIRLDSGVQAFSMPIGTMQACSFNPELVEKLYACCGLEMRYNNVDILLGPGINIHRSPLNGRNFEYFSEDPFITGKFAAATIRGFHASGVSGSLKHYAGNNQELGRRTINDIVSARAMREIYLKGYEMAVKEAGADVIMTTYGGINGTWTASSYDLNTTILRDEWGFKGIVMTDWWAELKDEEDEKPLTSQTDAMIRAQNDLWMVSSDAHVNSMNDNTLTALAAGDITREELLRNADNIITWVKKYPCGKRAEGCAEPVEIINRPETDASEPLTDMPWFTFTENGGTVDLTGLSSSKGGTYVFGIDAVDTGMYELTWTAKSESSEIAQMPVSVMTGGVIAASLTWNGTNGAWKPQSHQMMFFSKYSICKLFFAQAGLDFKDLQFKLIKQFGMEEFRAMMAENDAKNKEKDN